VGQPGFGKPTNDLFPDFCSRKTHRSASHCVRLQVALCINIFASIEGLNSTSGLFDRHGDRNTKWKSLRAELQAMYGHDLDSICTIEKEDRGSWMPIPEEPQIPLKDSGLLTRHNVIGRKLWNGLELSTIAQRMSSLHEPAAAFYSHSPYTKGIKADIEALASERESIRLQATGHGVAATEGRSNHIQTTVFEQEQMHPHVIRPERRDFRPGKRYSLSSFLEPRTINEHIKAGRKENWNGRERTESDFQGIEKHQSTESWASSLDMDNGTHIGR
jgi:hypothetical protein